MATFFSEHFGIDKSVLDAYGAFDISLINDLPLFIDPFLLFHSEKDEYRTLHAQIIDYLVFLRDKAASGAVDKDLLSYWYCFPEVKQNWFGFSLAGNGGTGLGMEFAEALHGNLNVIFSDFGDEQVTEGSHFEKVCLIADGVGRDNISDFTTNLILDYLCRYTEAFAALYLGAAEVRSVTINRARFNYETESWQRGTYTLPWVDGDYVLLTPKDMLTRDENWINKSDLISDFENIPTAIPDGELRSAVFNYFYAVLARRRKPKREPTQKERNEAAGATLRNFPQIIDYYIKLKEETGEEAADISSEKVAATEIFFNQGVRQLQQTLATRSQFYQSPSSTYVESHARLGYLKDVIEHNAGWRIFYGPDGVPIRREKDLHILYRLVWFGSPSEVSTEVNDGRGPVDFKISRGAKDKTLVEFKLASNSKLEQNLAKQLEIYQRSSGARHGIKAIVFFTEDEELHVRGILRKLHISDSTDVVLIDARSDNKPSASTA